MDDARDDKYAEVYKDVARIAEDDEYRRLETIARNRELHEQMIVASKLSEVNAKARRVKFGKGRGYYPRVPKQYQRKAF